MERCQTMMKMQWFVFFAYLLPLSPLHAQGGFPTNPYCAQYSDGTSLDCGFSTLSMCYQSVTGVGGVCINNPHAGGIGSADSIQSAFGSSSVPPPQPQGPLQLPVGLPLQQQAQAPGPSPQPACNPLFDGTYCASAARNSFAPIQSLSSDLTGGAEPPATLGAATFSGDFDCIGILRRASCGGS